MSKHSPGPWLLGPNPDRDELLDLRDCDGFLIGTMSPHGMPANARRLIVAAPEMAELLRRLDRLTPTHPPSDRCGCVVCDARALLKRIDGETQSPTPCDCECHRSAGFYHCFGPTCCEHPQ